MTFIKKSVLPDQTGNNNKFLKTDGTNTSWAAGGSGGISDGDKGDITVSSSGSVWTIDNLAVTDAKINDVAATKVTEDSTHRFVTDTEKSTWNNKADLVGGKVPSSQIPDIAITEFLGSVSSQSAMLALVGQKGDWCIRTDVQYGYVIVGTDPSLIGDWQQIVTPASPVTTVNSQVGNVVLGKADIGLNNVVNADTTTTLNITDSLNKRFVTDSQLTTINNTSGTNTGDETTATIQTKLGTSSTSTSGYLTSTDWNTFNNKSRLQYNNSTSSQSITANTVTYLTGSAITTANIKAGTVVTWDISVTKTNAGTAAPAWTVRFGTNASTADTTILTFTGAAQTAAVDTGMITIQCTFRTVGSGTSAVLVGHYRLVHQLDSTGLSTGNGGAFATSAGFNSTTASAFLGVTVNSGASAAWTVNQVNVKIENIL